MLSFLGADCSTAAHGKKPTTLSSLVSMPRQLYRAQWPVVPRYKSEPPIQARIKPNLDRMLRPAMHNAVPPMSEALRSDSPTFLMPQQEVPEEDMFIRELSLDLIA